MFSEAVSTDEARAFFKKLGNDVFTLSPEESQKYYEREYKNWGEWVGIAKIEPQ